VLQSVFLDLPFRPVCNRAQATNFCQCSNLWNDYPDVMAVPIGSIPSLMVPVTIVMMMPIWAVPIVVLNHDGCSFRALGSREYHSKKRHCAEYNVHSLLDR